MLTKEQCLAIVEKAIHLSEADETEALLSSSDSALTRYAGNIITQNTSADATGLTVRAILGSRVGRASTNRFDDNAVADVVKRATAAAREAEDDPDVAHPVHGPFDYKPVDTFDPETASLSPVAKADAIRYACSQAKEQGMEACGSYSNEATGIALANSNGILAYHAASQARFATTVASDNSSGWAEGAGSRAGKIDVKKAADTAAAKAVASHNPQPIEPGAYTVILEPAAVTDFLVFLTGGFGAKSVAEGRSFLSGKIGTPVFGSNISITDDPFHPEISGMAFDFEGVPKEPIVLIDNGVAKQVVHDSITAQAAGCRSTGHGLPQPNPSGPAPLNLILAGGDSNLEEMIASTERGVLVTHFHYTNVIDPMRVVLTGMTRDGTFLIENGKIKHPVRNLRFTQSVVEALNNVEAIASEPTFQSGFFGGGSLVPAMKINEFVFSSTTEF